MTYQSIALFIVDFASKNVAYKWLACDQLARLFDVHSGVKPEWIRRELGLAFSLADYDYVRDLVCYEISN